jgi:V/A-type H+-transporting ATPase subunit I
MLFFTIFYAMIIGDAGYGMLFMAGSLFLAYKFRKDAAKKSVVALALILSAATIIWGALCGSYFGVQFGGIKALTDPAVKDGNVKVFCFALALAQLALGHFWQAFASRSWRTKLANAGWILMLAGNFLLAVKMIAWPEAVQSAWLYYCYVPGLLLVVACGVNWRDVGDVFQFPFSVINGFTDVLSYIRLFAVGMAGACISGAFNGMAADLAKVSPFLVIGAVICLLLGHGLNLALNILSVLVHAVRLNTLEFSSHTGLSWSGKAFKPFKHKE